MGVGLDTVHPVAGTPGVDGGALLYISRICRGGLCRWDRNRAGDDRGLCVETGRADGNHLANARRGVGPALC